MTPVFGNYEITQYPVPGNESLLLDATCHITGYDTGPDPQDEMPYEFYFEDLTLWFRSEHTDVDLFQLRLDEEILLKEFEAELRDHVLDNLGSIHFEPIAAEWTNE